MGLLEAQVLGGIAIQRISSSRTTKTFN